MYRLGIDIGSTTIKMALVEVPSDQVRSTKEVRILATDYHRHNAKPKKVDGHNHGDYLIGTHRTAATTNPNCTRLYIRKANTYGQVISMSSRSLAARTRFSEVQAAVNERVKDLSKIAQDRQAFLEQKDTAGGKKTMRAYLWKICGDEYDQQHS